MERNLANDIVIFVQAPADVVYMLDVVAKNEEKRIFIVVINVESVYLFVKELNLLVYSLVYIPYSQRTFCTLYDFYQEKNRIRKIWKECFISQKICKVPKVYFFSRYEDWLGAYFINRVYRTFNADLYYINHYDDDVNLQTKSLSIKSMIFLFALWCLTGIVFLNRIPQKFPEFPVSRYLRLQKVEAHLNYDCLKKYYYKISPSLQKKILFLINDTNEELFRKNVYENSILDILCCLKNIGFYLILKGHPRMGSPSFLSKVMDEYIPKYIPSEFLDPSTFHFVIGVDSVSISHMALHQELVVISLLRTIPSINEQQINVMEEYLLNQSLGAVSFPTNRRDLLRILNE